MAAQGGPVDPKIKKLLDDIKAEKLAPVKPSPDPWCRCGSHPRISDTIRVMGTERCADCWKRTSRDEVEQ